MICNIHSLVGFYQFVVFSKNWKKSETEDKIFVCGFWSSMMFQFESSVRTTTDSERRGWNMRVYHKAMKLVVRAPYKYELKVSIVKMREPVARRCLPLPASYCYDNREGKKGSSVERRMVVKRHFDRCMLTEEDIMSIWIAWDVIKRHQDD